MGKQNVAESLVETLAAAGVERVYGVAGDSLNGVTDAIRRRSDIRWIHVRHEEAAAFAAGADTHLTGGLAVCAGSCGPGNLHLINGLYDAQRSRVPVLAIAAHIPTREIGGGYFQETHPEQLFRECSHFCELVSPEQFQNLLDVAVQTALSRRGVAVLVLPGDIALQPGRRASAAAAGRAPVAGRSSGRRGARAAGRAPERRAFDHDGPALVDVRVARQELSMPPTIQLEQMVGLGSTC